MADLIFGIAVNLLGIVVSRTDFFVADGIFLRVICDKEFNLELLAYTVDGVAIFLRTINLGFGCFLQKHHFFSHITLYTRFQFRTCFGTGFDCIVVDGF